MKVRIDFELCQSHGVCMEEAPEVFEVQADGTVRILLDEPPDALAEKVKNAVRYCPTHAIFAED